MRLAELGVVAAILLFFFGGGKAIVNNYTDLASEKGRLSRELEKTNIKLASYERMVERRDAAIAHSKCAVSIKGWVSHPETLPTPFNVNTVFPSK